MADKTPGKCPICTAPWCETYKPFCSRRCADVDLSRWLRGSYNIPIVNDDEDDDGMPVPDEIAPSNDRSRSH